MSWGLEVSTLELGVVVGFRQVHSVGTCSQTNPGRNRHGNVCDLRRYNNAVTRWLVFSQINPFRSYVSTPKCKRLQYLVLVSFLVTVVAVAVPNPDMKGGCHILPGACCILVPPQIQIILAPFVAF